MIEAEYRKLEAAGRIYFGKDNTSQPQVIRYLYEVEGLTPWTWLPHEEVGHTDEAKKEIHGLLGKVSAFDTPKPTRLLTRLLQVAANTNDFLVMDFFAGSGTTAHAVYVMNARDGGTRRCITVQIAEIQDNSLDTERKNIAEICKERMRRAGKRVLDAWTTDQDKAGQLSLTVDGYGATIPPDIGFRVLKIDTSNMKDVYYIPDQSKQRELLSQVSNVKEDRTPEDLLFQVLVDRGVDLHLSIVQEVIEGFTVFFVDTNALAACFDTNLTEELVLALAKRQPLRAVFRDNSFEDDSARINVEQIFKTLSPRTSVRSI